jgi:hemolysin D
MKKQPEALAAPAAAAIPRAAAPPAAVRRRGAEREFLPAALEILETPASPIGRAMGATLLLFFAVAIAWATFGQVDIIAVAAGKIVPTGRTKTIQPLEAGTITAIHVQDGDQVKAGEVLIELDRTVTTAERNRVGHDLMRARLDVARLTALRVGLDGEGGRPVLAPPPGAPAEEVERAGAAMTAQAAEQGAKLAAIAQQIAQKAAEAEEVATMIAKITATLPLVEDLAVLREKAMNMEYGNRVAHIEAQLRLTEQRHDLLVQQRRANEVSAARQALEWQREQTRAEYAHKILSDLADARQKAAELTEDAVKAQRKMSEQVLVAPIDGTVQQLAVHTVGGVVTPAQQLMVLVPAGSRLEAEAMVSNRDIGFVRPGQEAEIKIDTFNFTRYGLLRGAVSTVSQDAIVREKPPEKGGAAKSGALADTSEPQGQEFVYAARIALDSQEMRIEDRVVPLSPGMAVSVEIKTGHRRVIEYLISPLLRYKQESLRER